MTLHAAVAGWLLGPPSGANRRLLALLEAVGPLLADDERVTVLHRPDLAPPDLPRIAWQPIAIPAGPTWRRALAERRLLPGVLQALGATVYDHGFLPLPRVAVPRVLLVHDVRALDGLTRWPRWLAAWVLRRALTRASAVVAPSAWTAARLQAVAPHVAVDVVHNGVAVPTSVPPLHRPLPPHGYLLHIGHLEARKNLGVVLAALRQLPAATRPELWLAGRDAGALRSLRAAAGDVVVHALGAVADDTLAALYAQTRAVVLPSRHEGFGMPALEGLAHGVPVLVATGSALPEVVGDAGVCLPPDDAAAWAAAIAAPSDRGDAPRRRARAAAFGWPAAATQLLAVWRRTSARR